MKLWQKTTGANQLIEKFTVGNDKNFDLLLAKHDITGTLAHTAMLEKIGLLSREEKTAVHRELRLLLAKAESGTLVIDEGVEDIHSQIEFTLTQQLGETGKKIHAARSRNDQVLTAIKLFIKDELKKTADSIAVLFDILLNLSEKHKAVLLPGYTHLQIAMPSSFGLWFSAYAESLSDDLEMLIAAYRVADKNPLGSGAGYGSSFPIDREMTTELGGFSEMNINAVYAQMTRGKTEKFAAVALAAAGATLARMSMDICLYMSQNFGFVSFPDELTTGSSIMPHKKNPDVFELIRAKCNRLQSVPNELTLLITNLPSGYHRDLQLTKEILFPAFASLQDCLEMSVLMLKEIRVNEQIAEDDRYKYMFTVEAVNTLVLQGIPFREAYKSVGMAVEAGVFKPGKEIKHMHTGSIGNLANDRIQKTFREKLAKI
ncbi:MAG: argininosuccinate lyase [Bacteroidetes bacterium]|nr:MAG: argininosuccinate lyase [Bacteroidota bacterium]